MRRLTDGRLPPACAVVLLVLGGILADAAGQTVTCKGTRVPVTVGDKTTCVPLARVFPKPKAIDIRLAYLKAALKIDASVPGDGSPSGRKRALKRIRRALRKTLTFIDRESQAGVHSSPIGREPAVAATGCSVVPDTQAGNVGAVKVIISVGPNGEGATMEYAGGGHTYRLTYVQCRGGGLPIPKCPSASGDVEATSAPEHFEVTTEDRDGETVLRRQSTTFDDTTTVKGKVKDDARLEYIEIDSKEHVLTVGGGNAFAGDATRHAHVDMPSGRYDPEGTNLHIEGDPGADIKAEAFAARVAGVIEAYREAEKGWSSFDRMPYCAEAVLSPASDTLRLRNGEKGQVSIYAKARQDGGTASGARWSLLSPLNAQFSPSSSRDAEPTISYTVAAKPAKGKVQVTVKFTSTAGVGKQTWTEEISDGSIDHIGGTIQGSEDNGYSRLDWNGNAAFDRNPNDPGMGGANGTYLLASGDYTVTASGGGSYGCQQSGVQQFTIPAGYGEMSVLGQGPDFGPPYSYSFVAAAPGHPTMKVKLSSCPSGEESHNGELEDIEPQVEFGDQDGAISPDGIEFPGSWTRDSSGVIFSQSWSFHGTE